MSCLQEYIDACDAADNARDIAIENCNGNTNCERAAIQSHYAAIVAAYEAYLLCVANSQGGPSGD